MIELDIAGNWAHLNYSRWIYAKRILWVSSFFVTPDFDSFLKTKDIC